MSPKDTTPSTSSSKAPLDGSETLSAPSREGVPAERNLRFWTAAEITSNAPEAPPWVCEPWVAPGCLTEVNGPPKDAGKTTLMMHMVRTILDGVPFLEKETMQSPVVYLTEERHTSFREVLARPGLEHRQDLHVLFRHDARGFDWPDVVHAATKKCKECGASVLIVDTFPPFVELDGDKENNSGDILKALDPLQAAAAQGVGVVVVRHERKRGGSVSVAGRGSSAFTAAMDIVMSIRRAEGNARPTIRQVRAVSRFDATPDSLFIDLTDAGYVSLGDSAAVAVSEAEQAIWDTLPNAEKEALTVDELITRSGKRRTTAQEALKGLTHSGIETTVSGKKKDPYRYWIRPVSLLPADHDSAGTHTLGAAETRPLTSRPEEALDQTDAPTEVAQDGG